jgi:DNA-binding CsgD family transcriptional regulator/tetratricopeptide (TPR) repeat protein
MNMTQLLEREAQLATLAELQGEVAAGSGHAVFVAGEAGAGKSALVQRFCDSAAASSRILVGFCDPLASPRPLGPLVDIAPGLGADVADLLKGRRRHELFEATLTALAGHRQPSIVVFEDLQWADQATLDLLRFLGRRLPAAGTLLVGTYREDEVGPDHLFRVVLGDLASCAWVDRMVVPPLSAAAVASLSAGSAIDSAALHRDTGGNPFFVTEVLASGEPGVPAAVADAVMSRASRLTGLARFALEAAAVIGRRVEPSLLLRIGGVDALALDECVSAGMLSFTPPFFVFRHELARQAIVSATPPHRRVSLHAEVLGLLRGGALSPELLARLADHAEEAGDPEAVLEYAPRAAELASGLQAHRQAETQYARALRFADNAEVETRAILLERRSYECYLIDHLADAVDATRQAIEIWRRLDRPLKVGDNLRLLSRIQWVCGQGEEAESAGTEALAVLEPLPPGPELAMAVSNQSQLGMLAGDHDRAITWGERAIEMARELGEERVLANALNNVGSSRLMRGDLGGEELLLESLRIAVENGLEDDAGRAYSNLAASWGMLSDFKRSRKYLDEGLAYCNQHDLYSAGLCIKAEQSFGLVNEGRWDEAMTSATSLLEERKLARISKIELILVQARVRTRRGEPDVWPLLDEALELAVPTAELQYLGLVAAARAEARWLSGETARVEAEVRAAFEMAVSLNDSWYMGELAFWLWKAGHLVEPPAGAAPQFALQIAGDWKGAAERWAVIGFPYEAAQALADGDEAAVRQALAEFDRLGARPAAAEAARRLRVMGVRGIPRGPRMSTKANAAGLTSREQEILQLVAEGLTNRDIAARLFLSEKTVGHHVSAILGKLDVPSRTQAARLAATQETRQPTATR